MLPPWPTAIKVGFVKVFVLPYAKPRDTEKKLFPPRPVHVIPSVLVANVLLVSSPHTIHKLFEYITPYALLFKLAVPRPVQEIPFVLVKILFPVLPPLPAITHKLFAYATPRPPLLLKLLKIV